MGTTMLANSTRSIVENRQFRSKPPAGILSAIEILRQRVAVGWRIAPRYEWTRHAVSTLKRRLAELERLLVSTPGGG